MEKDKTTEAAGATAEDVVEDSEMGDFVQPSAFAPGVFSPAAAVKDQGHGNESSGAGAKVQAQEEGEGALGDGDDVVEDDTRKGGGETEYEDDRLARVSEKISSTALIVGSKLEEGFEQASAALDVGIDSLLKAAKDRGVREKLSSVKSRALGAMGGFVSAGVAGGGGGGGGGGGASAGRVAASSPNNTPLAEHHLGKGLSAAGIVCQVAPPGRVVCACESTGITRRIGSLFSSDTKTGFLCSLESSSNNSSSRSNSGKDISTSTPMVISQSTERSPAPVAPFTCVAGAAKGGHVAAGDRNGAVWLLELNSNGWSTLGHVTVHSRRVTAVAYSKRHETVVSGSLDSTVRVSRPLARDGGSKVSVIAAPSPVNDLALLPDERRVVVACQNGSLCTTSVNVRPAVPLDVSQAGAHPGGVSAVSVSAQGTRIASGGVDRRVMLWSLLELELTPLLSLTPPENALGNVSAVLFSGGDMMVAAGLGGGCVLFWELGDCLHPTLPLPTGADVKPPRCIVAHPSTEGGGGGVVSLASDSLRKGVWSGGAGGAVKLWGLRVDVAGGPKEVLRFDASGEEPGDLHALLSVVGSGGGGGGGLKEADRKGVVGESAGEVAGAAVSGAVCADGTVADEGVGGGGGRRGVVQATGGREEGNQGEAAAKADGLNETEQGFSERERREGGLDADVPDWLEVPASPDQGQGGKNSLGSPDSVPDWLKD